MANVSERGRPDRALGVFETLLVLDGAPVELDAHLARLRASVRELFGADQPARLDELVRERSATLGAGAGRLRLTVAPGAGGLLDADAVVERVDEAQLFPSWERAVTLRPLTIAGGLGAHKWVDRSAFASGADASLALVLDEDGEVLEAERANVFVVEDDVLLTPRADGRILPGVARARVLGAARTLDLELCVQPVGIERLLAAGEAFLTGSVRGVEPVRAVGDVSLRAPGEVARAIADELRRSWTAARTALAT
ncbi:MAG: para-aminobenzoate synthetase / 4-amino-4-deoxychorismate lyase [Solirubrobacteraceae bacterium]|nr:para-aminobenzoate synthetase / 4-amino-4-deoxychorismate lyase [Solirubrobacteraceae bacterium]